jgi:hypothetical protein
MVINAILHALFVYPARPEFVQQIKRNKRLIPDEMKITGTFLDAIAHRLPSQNWGEKEWKQDFAHMRRLGFDTVILDRCGYRRWLAFPSEVLMDKEEAYEPSFDWVELFLELSQKHDMAFFFGLYDSGRTGAEEDHQKELDLNRLLIDEVWARYGHHEAFRGWYLCQEVDRWTEHMVDLYLELGTYCKNVSDGLPVLISPLIRTPEAVSSEQKELTRGEVIHLSHLEKDWEEIFDILKHAIDIVAFQCGPVAYHELPFYFEVYQKLAARYGIHCWINAETFDRDFEGVVPPIRWEKLRLKLEAARQVKLEKTVTFEFSHFMSPQSAYPQAHHLYDRYLVYQDGK